MNELEDYDPYPRKRELQERNAAQEREREYREAAEQRSLERPPDDDDARHFAVLGDRP